jgi:hypothetical protein
MTSQQHWDADYLTDDSPYQAPRDYGPPTVKGPPENYCGFNNCPCTHADGCVKGWIDDTPDLIRGARLDTGELAPGRVLIYQQTTPCATCRPILASLLNQASSPAEKARLLHLPRMNANG